MKEWRSGDILWLIEAIGDDRAIAGLVQQLRASEWNGKPVKARVTDASGQARLDFGPGTANDRFTAEVEIAKDDFGPLRITPGNGFRDEVVELRVLRGGVLVFSNRLQFSLNLPNDITFETDIRGVGAPELRAGDVARLFVNGHFTLRGRFQVH